MKKLVLILCIGLLVLTTTSCSKDDEKNDNNPVISSVTDADGNVYHTVIIGTQTWMLENLKTTRFNDGTAIPNVSDQSAWAALTTNAYCDYDNNTANGTTYGRLYNWHCVNSGKLAPEGWHVATKAEWEVLSDYASANTGTSGSEAKALAAITGWNTSTVSGTPGCDPDVNNSSGFTALAGGYRAVGEFYGINGNAMWWSSSESNSQNATSLSFSFGTRNMINFNFEKYYGMSVRCIKD
jgi:uncharacterized protein (TIGR02145 family)